MTPRTGRELPEDLRDYRAPEGDGFQMVPPDVALVLLLVGLVLGYILGAFGRVAS